ncbi:MAG TPA: CBS domain-containing protein [Longimicrobiales bacterium]|nr:CBS domain-containing protein [Longimicrobiales bacterium]
MSGGEAVTQEGQTMRAQDIMTRDTITVAPTTSIRDAARLMVDHGISGLPVVGDRGTVVGIVSEGDLIVRQRPRTRLSWWQAFFDDGERLAREYSKAVGLTCGEVMTREVITVAPETEIESVAALLDAHRIRRVPVLREGRLVGIVSRGDLVKALAALPVPTPVEASDAELVREMDARLQAEPWVRPSQVAIHADRGVMSIWGMLGSQAEKSAIETMARSIPGVKAVNSHLVVSNSYPPGV